MKAFYIIMLLSILTALVPACVIEPQVKTPPVPPTFVIEMPAPPPEWTPEPTHKPQPTITSWPTLTPKPSPTATSTSLPLPEREAVLKLYQEELKSLVSQLAVAGPAPASFTIPVDRKILLVPLSEELYYIQTVIFPDWETGSADSPAKLYILYSYSRGGDLGYFNLQTSSTSRETQEVLVDLSVVAEVDGKRYRVEKQHGLGGAGSEGLMEYTGNLVSDAVPKLETLGSDGDALEQTLETIIGYACGYDWQNSLDRSRKLTLFLQALESPYWADRHQSIHNLGDIEPPAVEAVPALIGAVQDRDQTVSLHAIEALGHIGAPAAEAAPVIIQVLKDDESWVRNWAVNALANIGPAAVPALITALSDNSPAIRAGVVETLGKIGAEEGVIPALVQILADKDNAVVSEAISVLKNMPADQTIPYLIPLLAEKDARWRANATQALAAIGEPAVPILLETLNNPDELVRMAAVHSLGQIKGDNRIIPALILALSDPEWIVRDAAALGLGDLQAVEAIPALVIALSDPEYGVRWSAALALGYIGSPARDAVPALIQALSDPEQVVRQSAADALRSITGQDFGRDAAQWQQWWNEQAP